MGKELEETTWTCGETGCRLRKLKGVGHPVDQKGRRENCKMKGSGKGKMERMKISSGLLML